MKMRINCASLEVPPLLLLLLAPAPTGFPLPSLTRAALSVFSLSFPLLPSTRSYQREKSSLETTAKLAHHPPASHAKPPSVRVPREPSHLQVKTKYSGVVVGDRDKATLFKGDNWHSWDIEVKISHLIFLEKDNVEKNPPLSTVSMEKGV